MRHAVATALAAGVLASPAQGAAGSLSPQLEADRGRLPATTPYEAIVRFRQGSPGSHRARLLARGLEVTGTLRSLPAYVVTGRLGDIARLGRVRGVAYVEPDPRLRWLGDTAPWATRVRVAQEAVSGGPYRDGSGRILDGTGIGVAIVDSGVEARHPDLVNRVVNNYKVHARRTNLGPGSSSDTTSGHGTHVSGIVAGDGTASQGTYRGVAPGSLLHVFSGGETISMAFAVESLDLLYSRFSTFSPRVRVVNNSWGNPGGSQYNPNGLVEVLTRKLVQDKGVLMVFAAGNDGGDGSQDKTSSYCKDPTPGVVCAANYDDANAGSRNNTLDESSSRGKRGEPATYPDVSAPGASITSTCSPTALLCNAAGFITPSPGWAPWYGSASGTSMAAPHISAIAALLLQAKPSLTPAELEDVIVDTAHRFAAGGEYVADPQNTGGMTSFDKGSGLADAVAALSDPRVGLAGSNEPSPSRLTEGDGGDFSGAGAVDLESLDVELGASGVWYTIAVRDASDVPLGGAALRVTQNVADSQRRSTVNLSAAGPAPRPAESPDDPATAEADVAVREGNLIRFHVPYAELGDPAPGSPAHNVFASSFIQGVVDAMPSPSGPAIGGDVIVRPKYAPAYTVR